VQLVDAGQCGLAPVHRPGLTHHGTPQSMSAHAYARKCLALAVDTSLSRTQVGRELHRIAETRGYAQQMVSDNETKLTSRTVLC